MQQLLENGTPWQLVETGLDPITIQNNETLFSLSNGHIGTRGSLEEAKYTPSYFHNEGTYMNGFHEISPINYSEWAFGYAANHQTTSPLPNAKQMRFAVNGEWFDLEHGTTSDHRRVLDLQKGLLTRHFIWENSQQDKVEVKIERFVSYDIPELLAQHIQIIPLTDGVELTFETILDDLEKLGKKKTEDEIKDPRVKNLSERLFTSEELTTETFPMLHIETPASQMHAIVGTAAQLRNNDGESEQIGLKETWTCHAKTEEPVVLERFAAYSSFYLEGNQTPAQTKVLRQILETALKIGYKKIKENHVQTMSQFWEKSDVVIEGDDHLQKGLRFNLFHLHQAAGRNGKTNMSAKGLTGPGYEGHYFWDTEMYMLPFFIYTQPEIAKQLLLYRHTILPKAKERAKTLSVSKGVLFPWRTINGEEASAYYPAGTAQFHINADIAHAVHTYSKATGDKDFAYNEGLEILIETARFWVAFGHYDALNEKAFVINGVTGPDEYTTMVNNNFYTNLMAKHNLDYAVEMVMESLADDRTASNDVLEKIGFELSELEEWTKASEAMFLPYDETRGLTKQDDSFFHKKLWDFEGTPKENHPLLLHYHPLAIYRYQVNKQADTVLAEFLFSWEFDSEQKQRDYAYYEDITTHDSSLSRSIFGIMASEIGDSKRAYNYFMDTALMDITDLQANTKDGVHAANMGGTWLSMVQGFARMRLYNDQLHFEPYLPEQWQKVSFNIQFHSSLFQVTITQEGTAYKLLEGEPVDIEHNGTALRIE
ncbi:glycoside hydrolase family 65 protein [Desemzia sp. RIT804]|uniref:glycoside hydrolase family 65 protein n=1 Tax=Desemzia sp. RIT 804 TaxID=2810209 RepID=UPI001951C1FB|nr:glycosyl hydrolase family 65 protein [Desemzia sp. RIT 804]MBM6615396.1 glycoside hydrolase family 65 protein [Desemzia sp. RIT 804]